MDRPIGVFDSGIGGLSVLHKCAAELKNESFIYLADFAGMPYGEKSEDEIRLAAVKNASRLISMNCKAVVVACNTATEVGIAEIRRLYPNTVTIGLEPAVKPCARELSPDGYAVALVTPATANSDKFNSLLRSYGRVAAVGCAGLAQKIENGIFDLDRLRADVYRILGGYKNAEAVVLGCSHYAYITSMIKEFYGGKIKIYDGADGLAQNLVRKLGTLNLLSESSERTIRFYSTQKRQNKTNVRYAAVR